MPGPGGGAADAGGGAAGPDRRGSESAGRVLCLGLLMTAILFMVLPERSFLVHLNDSRLKISLLPCVTSTMECLLSPFAPAVFF